MSKDHPTLEAACEARQVNGDLVIHQDTGKIVIDPSWLFDWEYDKFVLGKSCYGSQAIEWQRENPDEGYILDLYSMFFFLEEPYPRYKGFYRFNPPREDGSWDTYYSAKGW